LDGDVARLPPRLLGPLRRLVLVLAVIHDPADGRARLRRHLDEVEVGRAGDREGLGQGLDPDLLTVRTDEPHLTGADAVVDPGFVVGRGYRRSLLIDAQAPPYAWDSVAPAPARENQKRTPGEADVRDGRAPTATDRPGRTRRACGRVGAPVRRTLVDQSGPASLDLSDVGYQRVPVCPPPGAVPVGTSGHLRYRRGRHEHPVDTIR